MKVLHEIEKILLRSIIHQTFEARIFYTIYIFFTYIPSAFTHLSENLNCRKI